MGLALLSPSACKISHTHLPGDLTEVNCAFHPRPGQAVPALTFSLQENIWHASNCPCVLTTEPRLELRGGGKNAENTSLFIGHWTSNQERGPACACVRARAHTHTHTHTASQAMSVGHIRPTGSRPNPDSATCDLGDYFKPSKSQVSHVQCTIVHAHPTVLL